MDRTFQKFLRSGLDLAPLGVERREENDRLLGTIKLDKDDYHLLRYYNMMVVNRPAALSLQ